MSTRDLISFGDLESARWLQSGTAVDDLASRFLAAADDPSLRAADFDPGLAMIVVSELLEAADRLEEALAVLRRAETEGVRGEFQDPGVWLVRLLHKTRRTDEAAALFRSLVKTGRADWTAYEIYAEQLEDDDPAGALKLLVSGQEHLVRQGNLAGAQYLERPIRRVRRTMGFPDTPHSSEPGDDGREDWNDIWDDDEEWDEANPRTLFWPRDDFDHLAATWPTLAEKVGTDWDNHRNRIELAGVQMAREGVKLHLLCADFAAFAQLMARYPDLADPLGRYLDESPQAPDQTWPPERNAKCWCRSDRKYKQCCRPLGLGSHS
jgi:hypothetical protein